MKLISVIIPVYNLENYIVNCLDSIYSQGVDEEQFEVIAVDDGSKDQSLFILNDYASKHTNFKVLTQTNAGVSIARNNGMKEASGKYVTFVDGDDELVKGGFLRSYYALAEKGMDVLYCNAFAIEGEKNHQMNNWKGLFEEDESYKGEVLLYRHFDNAGSVCGGFYKMDYIRNLNLGFGERIANCEDTIFCYLLYSTNPTIGFINIDYYQVNYRPGSAIHSISIERTAIFKNNIRYLQNLKKNARLTKLQNEAVDMSMYYSISMATNMYKSAGGRDWRYLYDLLDIKNLWHLKVSWAPKHQRFKMAILNLSFHLYVRLIMQKK